MKKLPYIPDKDLYAAVMFACKMIRENGYFNKAIRIASDYYDVDEDDVKHYVRIAQGNGQRKANRSKPKRQYHWYLVMFVPDYTACDDNGTCWTWDYSVNKWVEEAQYRIVRATNSDNAYIRVEGAPKGKICGYYFNHVFKVLEFNTKKEAEEYAKKITRNDVKNWVTEYKK